MKKTASLFVALVLASGAATASEIYPADLKTPAVKAEKAKPAQPTRLLPQHKDIYAGA